jgi:hypothetical protein
MIENYMDYSAESCQNSFTAGQVTLMHGVLEGPRYDLVYGNPASVNSLDFITWNVFPNPSNGEINIQSDQRIAEVEVISIAGAKVYSASPNTEKTTIDLSHCEAGIYIVSVRNESTSSRKRVVIQ